MRHYYFRTEADARTFLTNRLYRVGCRVTEASHDEFPVYSAGKEVGHLAWHDEHVQGPEDKRRGYHVYLYN